jgi:hypothetical protein
MGDSRKREDWRYGTGPDRRGGGGGCASKEKTRRFRSMYYG